MKKSMFRRYKKRTFKKKKCFFSMNNIQYIDYKEIMLLKNFIKPDGSIKRKDLTGTTVRNQRFLTKAIKRAREIGLLPFVNQT